MVGVDNNNGNDANNNNASAARIIIPWRKVVAVVVLLLLCTILQVTVWGLQVHLDSQRRRLLLTKQQQQQSSDENQMSTRNKSNKDNPYKTTVKESRPSSRSDIVQFQKDYWDPNTNKLGNVDAYWNQVLLSGLLDYQGDSGNRKKKKKSSHNRQQVITTERALYALQKAAELGHPEAQVHVANAMATGYWTVAPHVAWNVTNPQISEDWISEASGSSSSTTTLDGNNGSGSGSSHYPPPPQSWLYWHMAAMAGNVNALLTLAERAPIVATGSTTTSSLSQCQQVLPYYSAAANIVMDELITDPQLRGRTLPVKDRHVLHKIHMHSSATHLDNDNRPDESPETLQFYHMRAMQLSSSHNNKGSKKDPQKTMHADATAAAAAYTLARYYHHGIKGAPQNLTLALEYYELAADNGHWEASGQAGSLHLWGMGTPQNAQMAYKYFQWGTGNHHRGGGGNSQYGSEYDDDDDTIDEGWLNCKKKYQEKLGNGNKKQGNSQVFLCDDVSLNGMGLLRLLGVPFIVHVDRDVALQYFTLARDQGNADAAYNLAMMKLGWKTYYQVHEDYADLEKQQKNSDGDDDDDDDEDPFRDLYDDDAPDASPTSTAAASSSESLAQKLFPLEPPKPEKPLTSSEYQRIMTDLVTAANKHHILARHRLGLFYEHGISVDMKTGNPNIQQTHTVVKKDCTKAMIQYKWIINHGAEIRTVRVRQAYQQYIAGQYLDSLRNYLEAAETGHDLAIMNAAFLLEIMDCPLPNGNKLDCSKATVRLWKAASASAEASLHIGDFYYYGRFRENSRHHESLPFGFLQHFIFPEEYLWPKLVQFGQRRVWQPLRVALGLATTSKPPEAASASCTNGDCPETKSGSDEHSLERDLAMAAHYYRLAADRSSSPRAHFNLGFMYQWGLGLKQDFPLAKRQYDLAISSTAASSREADVPVTLALLFLSSHESLVKLGLSWQEYFGRFRGGKETGEAASTAALDTVPTRAEAKEAGRPVPSSRLPAKTKKDVILAHLFSWESLAILCLTFVLSRLMRLRRTRR